MNYKWIIENQVAISLESREKLSSESIFQTIVTIEKEDFRLIWKWNDSSEVRHYMYTVGNYPNPTEFELYEFQQFINYENGIIVPIDEIEVYKAVVELLDDNKLRDKLSNNLKCIDFTNNNDMYKLEYILK